MVVFFYGLHLDGRQFGAIAEQFADQGALRFDGLPLLDDQHRHQAVREHEQHGKQWQPAMFLAGSFRNFLQDFFVFNRPE